MRHFFLRHFKMSHFFVSHFFSSNFFAVFFLHSPAHRFFAMRSMLLGTYKWTAKGSLVNGRKLCGLRWGLSSKMQGIAITVRVRWNWFPKLMAGSKDGKRKCAGIEEVPAFYGKKSIPQSNYMRYSQKYLGRNRRIECGQFLTHHLPNKALSIIVAEYYCLLNT